jgi:hypothetical protein
MIKKKVLNLGNSIYQQSGSGYGLTQKGGMLVNNAMDGVSGIQRAVDIKKSMKRAEKISTYSEAVALGNLKSDMLEGPEMDY